MKIILDTLMAGPNGVFHPGEYDMEPKLATELIKTKHARAAEPEKAAVVPPKVSARPVVEKAVLKPGETTTMA